jgi:hypothetical protein
MTAVVVENRTVVAQGSCALDDETDVRSAIEALFQTLPPMTRPAILVALDAPMGMLKNVTDVPRVRDPRVLEELLRQNADKYFIGAVADRVFAAIATPEGGTIAAYTRTLVEAITAATSAGGASSAVIMCAASVAPLPDMRGESELAIATGAAMTNPAALPAVSVGPRSRMPSARLAAGSAGILAAVLVLLSPIIRARHARSTAESEIRALGNEYRVAARAASEVASLRVRIAKTAGNGSRVPITELLGRLTAELPSSASLIALTVDSAKGSAVILATNAMDVLPALDSVALIETTQLSGPVTRERIGDRDLERATVVFTLRRGR